MTFAQLLTENQGATWPSGTGQFAYAEPVPARVGHHRASRIETSKPRHRYVADAVAHSEDARRAKAIANEMRGFRESVSLIRCSDRPELPALGAA
jgi:hypothetical protein